jgi:DNA-binding IclR family transcriptional regulator
MSDGSAPLARGATAEAAPAEGAPGAGLVQSVDRALTILKLLAAEDRLGVTEIAKLLGVHKSTASRLLGTLEAHGLAEQLPERGRYRLGVGVLRLAGATRARFDVVQESRTITRNLAEATGETVNLVILSGSETLYLDQVAGTSSLQIHNWAGRRNPVHATANGRVLLAHASTSEREAILDSITTQSRTTQSRTLPALTGSTITNRAALTALLEQVRRDGYAVAVDQLEVGLTAVAAPVRGLDGQVIASLSVSGPSFRLSDRVESVISLVREAATGISARMGHLARSN